MLEFWPTEMGEIHQSQGLAGQVRVAVQEGRMTRFMFKMILLLVRDDSSQCVMDQQRDRDEKQENEEENEARDANPG